MREEADQSESQSQSEAAEEAQPRPSHARAAGPLCPVFALGSWSKPCVQVLPQLTRKQLPSRPLAFLPTQVVHELTHHQHWTLF